MTKFVSIGFRPDIQGLRAIAVLLVILGHAGIPWVAGGFVGVDVFFVLSGFLISGLLLQEYEATGGLSLGTFYLRRLRRLLPALMVVLGLTSIMIVWRLPEADYRLILASLPFAASWTSNLYFVLGEQDYFNELADKDVFLHTWSLGVEEQFYLLWPLLLLGFIAATKVLSLRLSLLLLVVSSFLTSVAWSYWNPISAFYMMPARIWQFGLGGLVYLYCTDCRGSNITASGYGINTLFASGLLLILGSAFLLDHQTLYPGYRALFPSAGAAFVILAGSMKPAENFSSIGLAHPLLRWLGDRSYSLYLWHWTIIIYLGIIDFKVASVHSRLWLILLLTLLLAEFSYRWIELPFWKKGLASLPARTFLLGASATVLLLLVVAFRVQRASFSPETKADLATLIRNDVPVIYQKGCDTWHESTKVEPCVFGSADAPNTAVLLADSIGAQWFSAWAQIFASPQWRLVVLTKSACAMVDEDYYYKRIGKVYDVCRQWRESVLEQIDSFNPKVIIVGSAATYDFSPAQWVEGSKRVLERLSAVSERVVLVSGTPVLGFDGPGCILHQMQVNHRLEPDDCIGELSTDKFIQVAQFLSDAASNFSNVQLLNLVDLVCPRSQCRAMLPTAIPVFRDTQHLTDTFVRSTEAYLRTQISDIATTKEIE